MSITFYKKIDCKIPYDLNLYIHIAYRMIKTKKEFIKMNMKNILIYKYNRHKYHIMI